MLSMNRVLNLYSFADFVGSVRNKIFVTIRLFMFKSLAENSMVYFRI